MWSIMLGSACKCHIEPGRGRTHTGDAQRQPNRGKRSEIEHRGTEGGERRGEGGGGGDGLDGKGVMTRTRVPQVSAMSSTSTATMPSTSPTSVIADTSLGSTQAHTHTHTQVRAQPQVYPLPPHAPRRSTQTDTPHARAQPGHPNTQPTHTDKNTQP